MKDFKDLGYYLPQCQKIIHREQSINPHWQDIRLPDIGIVHNLLTRLEYVISQAFIPRSAFRYLPKSVNQKRLGLYLSSKNQIDSQIILESVSAHTTLTMALVRDILNYIYGINFAYTVDGYTMGEAMEVAFRHDLAEVITGDTPDNKTRDESQKHTIESQFLKHYSELTLPGQDNFETNVKRLHQEFEHRSMPTGRVIAIADKASAILSVQGLRNHGIRLQVSPTSPLVAPNDRLAMQIIDGQTSKAYDVDELWAVSYFETRHFIDFDDTGIMTELLILHTLKTRHTWFDWRAQRYAD